MTIVNFDRIADGKKLFSGLYIKKSFTFAKTQKNENKIFKNKKEQELGKSNFW